MFSFPFFHKYSIGDLAVSFYTTQPNNIMKKYHSLEDYGFPESFDRTKKSDVFYFLTKLNKDGSGTLLTEVTINQTSITIGGFPKYFPELYKEYKSIIFPEESKKWRFCQKIWHFLQDDYELKLGLCLVCGKRCTMESFREGYKTYCSTRCVNQSDKHKEHSCQTKELKYGDRNYNNRNKASETCLEKYGVENYSKTKEWKKHSIEINEQRKQKEFETKRKNHTFGTSKIETNCYSWLKELYPSVERQHKDELYPFSCDFYIPEFKLYIEIQASWTHGRHPFDENSKKDLETVQKWGKKNTNFYTEAIYNWTIRDVNKRNIAKQNKINYLEVFTNNFEKCKNIINTYINKNLLCQR